MLRRPSIFAFMALALLAAAVSRLAADDRPVVPVASLGDLLGEYKVSGINPNGTQYTGFASIQRHASSQEPILMWQIGDQQWYGDMSLTPEGTVRVDYTGAFAGWAEYARHADGSLHGTWGTSAPRVGQEMLIRLNTKP